ncbi:MAG: MucR family transcriptional regulator [Rhizobiaceae bacterium]|nr:MucR family transcriptional regulator [Rhizobiaceae bacterium]
MDTTASTASEHLLKISTRIICAYVAHNSLPASELGGFIGSICQSVAARTQVLEPSKTNEPAIAITASVTPDYIISLEDGRKFRTLARHLKTRYNMTPDEYRRKWGLPSDYPMVAPNYSIERAMIARNMRLGARHRPDKT